MLLGIPAVLAVRATGIEDAWTHAIWAFGLSLVAVAAGVAARVRVYFFGGVIVIVWVSLLYSFEYLVQFWWLLLGIVGCGDAHGRTHVGAAAHDSRRHA